jgi:hypothetical protein
VVKSLTYSFGAFDGISTDLASDRDHCDSEPSDGYYVARKDIARPYVCQHQCLLFLVLAPRSGLIRVRGPRLVEWANPFDRLGGVERHCDAGCRRLKRGRSRVPAAGDGQDASNWLMKTGANRGSDDPSAATP